MCYLVGGQRPQNVVFGHEDVAGRLPEIHPAKRVNGHRPASHFLERDHAVGREERMLCRGGDLDASTRANPIRHLGAEAHVSGDVRRLGPMDWIHAREAGPPPAIDNLRDRQTVPERGENLRAAGKAVDVKTVSSGREYAFVVIECRNAPDGEPVSPVDVRHRHGAADDPRHRRDVRNLLRSKVLADLVDHLRIREDQAIRPHLGLVRSRDEVRV